MQKLETLIELSIPIFWILVGLITFGILIDADTEYNRSAKCDMISDVVLKDKCLYKLAHPDE